jgi:hypothetical protein
VRGPKTFIAASVLGHIEDCNAYEAYQVGQLWPTIRGFPQGEARMATV